MLVDGLLALVLLFQLVDLVLLQLSGLVPKGLPCQILDQIVHLFCHHVPVDPFDQQSFALVLCLPLCDGLTEVCKCEVGKCEVCSARVRCTVVKCTHGAYTQSVRLKCKVMCTSAQMTKGTVEV